MNTKTCTKCHQVLTLDRFSICYGKPLSWCKECAAAYGKDYRAKNREKLRAKQRRYAAKNREKLRAYWLEYCAKNSEKRNIYQRRYRAKNREKVNANGRDRRAGKIVSKRTVLLFQTILLQNKFKFS